MNKTRIKNFAIWARGDLITEISNRARLFGISKVGVEKELPQSTSDFKFYDIGMKDKYAKVSGVQISQRNSLIKAIMTKEKDVGSFEKAFELVVDEVAYTWFNRLVAVRFMEVNDYLPSGIRVLSSKDNNKLEPDIVTKPFDTDLEFSQYERETVATLKDKNKLDELFRMLFIKQCNKLHEILPNLFEKTEDYSELLLSISFIDRDGIVYHLIHDIEEDDFNVRKEGQVEIIGWMYQYYNSIPKDTVFANLKKNIKIRKEDIPAATQLFTPHWIVRYMIENSLGRLWIEGHPNSELKASWKYYLEEAAQNLEVDTQLKDVRKAYSNVSPEDIQIIDPACGSGHILVYAFDVLMQIYEMEGYSAHEAASKIVRGNIYGLDIDDRAAQLAYFAIMMKARQYDNHFFDSGLQPNVYPVYESNSVDEYVTEVFCGSDSKLKEAISKMIDELWDAKEYGSILYPTHQDWNALFRRLDEIDIEDHIAKDLIRTKFLSLIHTAEVLSQQYDVVVTNPPYMSSSGMGAKLSEYLKQNYPDSKLDLYAVFIERCGNMTKQNGYQAMITQHTWMFVSSYEKLRKKFLQEDIVNMAHLGARAFEEINGEVVQTTSFVSQKCHTAGKKGIYCRLIEPTTQQWKEDLFLSGENRYETDQSQFSEIPGSPVAYWLSKNFLKTYKNETNVGSIGRPRQGSTLGNNASFLRFWFEIENTKNTKWFKCMKGGEYRRWYGNHLYVLDWENNGDRVKKSGHATIRNEKLLFNEGITWSSISSGKSSFRYMPPGFFFESTGSACFTSRDMLYYLLAFLNTSITDEYRKAMNPTLHLQSGDVATIPAIIQEDYKKTIDAVVASNIGIGKEDWDSFEVSWDFVRHPMVPSAYVREVSGLKSSFIGKMGDIAWHYEKYKTECEKRFLRLQKNEEKLNRIFISIYGLQDEITPDVKDGDVTVYRIYDCRDDIPENMSNSRYTLTKKEVVKSLISYAVGCMFGRYSLDVDGLVYAGGKWDNSKYSSFIPNRDNCIPITDDKYYPDDIVSYFEKFIKEAYGEKMLESNLTFIAKALSNKHDSSRKVIRNYFLCDFFKDHLKEYKKHPIYWLFDSGKENGFKALVYMHRWNSDTIGNIRAEYLFKLQDIFERQINLMQEIIDSNDSNRDVAMASKRKEKLRKQLKELRDYDIKIAHMASSRVGIDLDDGVKINYEKVQMSRDGGKLRILADI